jgi:hypothetical protein
MMAPRINAELAPNKCHGTDDTNASESRNGRNQVAHDVRLKVGINDEPESDEALQRRVKEAYGSLDDPQAKAMLDGRAKQKAAVANDIRAALAAEQTRLQAMKDGKKNGEG